jgi:hypothetical protein
VKRRQFSSQPPLLGIAELHDLSYKYQIEPLLRLLDQEEELVPDLLGARPWLKQTEDAQQVLEAILEHEWSGFVTHIGRVGPWVYAPTVADLQALSGAYTLLTQQARTLDLSCCTPQSLLGRLAGSEDWANEGHVQLAHGLPNTADAQHIEEAFWALARAKSEQQRNVWAARRSEPQNAPQEMQE